MTSEFRPRLGLACVTGAVLAALAAGVATAGSRSANSAASRRDAHSLLGRVLLPVGATRLDAQPPGDSGYLTVSRGLEGDQAHSLAHRWWVVPGTPGQLIRFVRAHPPVGGRLFGTGEPHNVRTGTGAEVLDYQWPGVRGVLGYRELALTATALPGGETGVLIETQSDWIVPRPTGEQIPTGTGEVDITSGTPRQTPLESLTVTDPSEVREIVKLINALPIAQPITYFCQSLTDPRLVTMSFRSTGATPALAVLTYYDFPPWAGPSEACKTVALTIGGRRQDQLIGGDFLQTIGRWLGRSLT